MQVNYEKPTQGGYVGATTVTTSETTLITITSENFTRQSQITAYFDCTLGSATSVKVRYYMSPNGGTTWYQIPVKNDATGLLADIPSVIDSTSPAQSSNLRLVEDIPFSGTTALKVTAQAVAASATMNSCYVYVRDN